MTRSLAATSSLRLATLSRSVGFGGIPASDWQTRTIPPPWKPTTSASPAPLPFRCIRYGLVGAGEIIGELSLIDQPRSASAIALCDSTFRYVTRQAFPLGIGERVVRSRRRPPSEKGVTSVGESSRARHVA